VSITVTAFLTAALVEIKVARVGDVPSPNVMDYALTVFNEYLESLNITERAIYNRSFATVGNLTPNLQPHTIGLAANAPTFSVATARPSKIRNANIVLANNIRSPLNLLDDDAWNALRAGAAAGQTPTILSSIPVDLYYDTTWPNGSIYLYPVPNTAYGLELEIDTLLAQVAQADTLDLPPGYQQALRLTVAELCAPGLGQKVSDDTARAATNARGVVWGNNDVIPKVCTRDAGMPGGSGGGVYDYRTGLVT
jgi:hypothetical protein